jgi:hypothetical protein
MKYTTERPYADPEKAARKLLEIANATEAVQDGRIHIEKINGPFLFTEGASPAEYTGGPRARDLPRPAVAGRRRAVRLMAAKGWQRRFEDPIALPDGRTLVTLLDAGHFIASLPKKEAALPEWQAAIEALMLVAERDGPTMLARIGVMRALNRGHVREFTSRKDPHWGRRKLKRDL